MGRPAKSRVPTKRAAQPKAPKENGTVGQPTKKKTGASGTRVTVGAPYVAADKPNVEGTALTVLDRAVLLPRALVPLPVIGLAPSPQAHDIAHAPVNICMSRCKDDAQVHAVVRIVAATARASSASRTVACAAPSRRIELAQLLPLHELR